MTAGLAQHGYASHHPRHEVDLGGFRHRFVDRARQLLPLPRPPAKQQRGDDGHGELLTGDVEGVPHLRGDRRQIVGAAGRGIVAAIHHHAPECQVHQVRALEVGPRAMVTERGHPRDDQGGTLLHQRVRAEPAPVELAPRHRLQQHVGGGDQRAEPIPVRRLAQVEDDRALSAVVLPEEQRTLAILPILVEGSNAARGAAAGRLHLDDVGAQPRQRQSTVLRLLVGQLDGADACERTPAGREVAGNRTRIRDFHGGSPILALAHPTARIERLASANISCSDRGGLARCVVFEQGGPSGERIRWQDPAGHWMWAGARDGPCDLLRRTPEAALALVPQRRTQRKLALDCRDHSAIGSVVKKTFFGRSR
jgi:hypothetical protein